jgi:hypothetical protein
MKHECVSIEQLSTISGQIIWLDNLRKLCKEDYDIWVNNQKISREPEWGRYCKQQQKIAWDDYVKYRKILCRIGVDTGDWKFGDWKI